MAHGEHGLGALAATGPGIVVLVPTVLAAALYAGAAWRERGRRGWPAHRTVLWLSGCALVAAAAIDPIAGRAHEDAVVHMLVHLAVGMVAPLLLVLAAPTTLAVRALAVVQARRLARLLRSGVVRVASHPIVTTTLHVGTMWALYRTEQGRFALHDPLLHVLVVAHLVVTGVLFTWSLVGIDPAPHRSRLAVRVASLVLAAAAHRILAVQLYADADAGASVAESQTAARVMSGGGDLVELALAIVLFAQWYRRRGRAAARRRTRRPPSASGHAGATSGAAHGVASGARRGVGVARPRFERSVASSS